MATNKEKLQIIVDAQGIAKTKAQLKGMDSATSGATKSFGLMAGGIAGATVALYAAGKALSSITKAGMDFEQGMANVKAISRATEAQFSSLEATAKRLGASTKFTATEVSGLQTEFAKLGFTASEINKVSEGTLALASAVGSDLATSAATAGSTLRGFGLDASETGRVTDVMAASFSQSALDMTKFSDSMKYVAPVAKLAGFEIEGTTAIMGQLANAGIDGSMAGTALRKIFLELSNSSSKLSKRLGGSVSSVDELIPALQKLNKEGISTAEMKDLVGQRAISAFSIMLSGSEDVDTLTKSLRNAGGEAKRMADIQLDTLEGSITKAKSAMEGLKISLYDTFSDELKFIIDDFTVGVQQVTNALEMQKLEAIMAGEGWETMTAMMKASLTEQLIALKKQAIQLEKNPSLLLILGDSMKWAARQTAELVFGFKGLGRFLKGNEDAVKGFTDKIWDNIKAGSIDQEEIEKLNEELAELEKQLKKTKGEIIEEPVIPKGKDDGKKPEGPKDTPVGPTDKQINDAKSKLDQFYMDDFMASFDSRMLKLEQEEQYYKDLAVLAGTSGEDIKAIEDIYAIKRKELSDELLAEETEAKREARQEQLDLESFYWNWRLDKETVVVQEEIAKEKEKTDKLKEELEKRTEAEKKAIEETEQLRVAEIQQVMDGIQFIRQFKEESFEEELAWEEMNAIIKAEALGLNETKIAEIRTFFDKKQIEGREKLEGKKRKIDHLELKGKLDQYAALTNATAGFIGEFVGGAKIAARMQQTAAVINTWSSATAALAPPPVGAGPVAGIPLAATIVMQGLANVMQISKSIGDFKTAQTGMDEIVTQPTLIMAGEGGRAEHIGITPLEGPNIDGPQGGGSITVNVSGNVLSDQFVEEELSEKISEAIRRGVDFGIS